MATAFLLTAGSLPFDVPVPLLFAANCPRVLEPGVAHSFDIAFGELPSELVAVLTQDGSSELLRSRNFAIGWQYQTIYGVFNDGVYLGFHTAFEDGHMTFDLAAAGHTFRVEYFEGLTADGEQFFAL